MIGNLEFEFLHLKADRRPEDPALSVSGTSPIEHSNPRKTTGRIPHISNPVQSVFQSSENRTPAGFNRDLKPCKAERESDSHPFPEKSCDMGGVSFPRDASPHSPWIKVDLRKLLVGAGLLVHYAAHIAEKTRILLQPKQQKPTLPMHRVRY
jgi:hypothetical protein